MTDRGAVITGIGLVTPVGRGVDEVFDALCAGRSGLVAPPEGHPAYGTVDVAGIGAEIDADRASAGRGAHRRPLHRDGAWPPRTTRWPTPASWSAATSTRTGSPASSPVPAGWPRWRRRWSRRTQKGRLGGQPVPAARHAAEHGRRPDRDQARHPRLQLVDRHRVRGRRPVASARACGCSAPARPTWWSAAAARRRCSRRSADTFGNARALARGWADPTEASRPFDRRRNGLVLAEGAGVFVLERAEHADGARRAPATPTSLGWGATTDAHHPTTPRPDGERRRRVHAPGAARRGRRPRPTSATSTPTAPARSSATWPSRWRSAPCSATTTPPVSSSKAITGHLLGASGVVEAAATVDGAAPRAAAADAQPRRPRPGLRPRPHPQGAARRARSTYALSNSFGFGGHNVSLVFGATWAPRGSGPAHASSDRKARHDHPRASTTSSCTSATRGRRAYFLCTAFGFRIRGPGRTGDRPGRPALAAAAARATSGSCSPPALSPAAPGGAVRGPPRRRGRRRRVRPRRRRPTYAPARSPAARHRSGRAAGAPRADADAVHAGDVSAASATSSTAWSSGAARVGEFLPGAIDMIATGPGGAADALLEVDRPRRGLPAGRRARTRPSTLLRGGLRLRRDLQRVHRGRRAGHGLAGGAEPVRRCHVHADRSRT